VSLSIELARFTVRDGSEQDLISERPAMLKALRERFPGCLAAYLTKETDGSWLDVLVWRSQDEAEAAAREIMNVPECAAWFRHIAESGGLRHVKVVDVWTADALR
jgi:hypothetical protein